MKKTIEITKLVVWLNRSIANCETEEEARAFCSVIDRILLGTDNYAGFGYLFNWSETSDAERERLQYRRSYYFSALLKKEFDKLWEAGDPFIRDEIR